MIFFRHLVKFWRPIIIPVRKVYTNLIRVYIRTLAFNHMLYLCTSTLNSDKKFFTCIFVSIRVFFVENTKVLFEGMTKLRQRTMKTNAHPYKNVGRFPSWLRVNLDVFWLKCNRTQEYHRRTWETFCMLDGFHLIHNRKLPQVLAVFSAFSRFLFKLPVLLLTDRSTFDHH